MGIPSFSLSQEMAMHPSRPRREEGCLPITAAAEWLVHSLTFGKFSGTDLSEAAVSSGMKWDLNFCPEIEPG